MTTNAGVVGSCWPPSGLPISSRPVAVPPCVNGHGRRGLELSSVGSPLLPRPLRPGAIVSRLCPECQILLATGRGVGISPGIDTWKRRETIKTALCLFQAPWASL